MTTPPTMKAFADELQPLVVFGLDHRAYGLPLENVLEVIRMVALTPLPDAPAWLAGMMDVRGEILPVVDLRVRLGLSPRPCGLDSRIILAASGAQRVGLVADAVTEVIYVPRTEFETVAVADNSGRMVTTLTRSNERVIIVLDPTRVIQETASFWMG
jgi:purine-binding chemotaxis protein CheW